MGLFGLSKEKSDETKVGNVEDFILLTRAYLQSVIATNLGITNIHFSPGVADFKRLFKIPMQGGKLRLAGKLASRKMPMQDYGLNESFFKETDNSVKCNCRTQNDIQSYLLMYQGFSNDSMMLMGNLMQWKFRTSSIFKKAFYGMTQKTVHDVCTRTTWKTDDAYKTAMTVRQYKECLGYSRQWMTDYVYNIVLLAKKESKRKNDDTETKKQGHVDVRKSQRIAQQKKREWHTPAFLIILMYFFFCLDAKEKVPKRKNQGCAYPATPVSFLAKGQKLTSLKQSVLSNAANRTCA